MTEQDHRRNPDEDPEPVDPLKERAFQILNDYISGRREELTVTSAPEGLIQSVQKERIVYRKLAPERQMLETADPEDVVYIQSSDGTGLLLVNEGYTATLRLDDTTAVATTDIESCYGYAAQLQEYDGGIITLMHVKQNDNKGVLTEILKGFPPNQRGEIAYTVPFESNTATGYINGIRATMHTHQPDIREASTPDTHGRMTPAGLLVTNRGGRFLTRSRSFGDFQKKADWTWNKQAT